MSSEVFFEDHWFQVIESADGHKALHAGVAFEPGDILVNFGIAAIRCEPTRYTIQCGVSEHWLVLPEFIQFINNSCDPNVILHTRDMQVRAVRRIGPGDEIVYFYPSTEWSLAEPFRCRCQSPQCLTRIAGAGHLPSDVLAPYYLSDHIATLLAERGDAAIAGGSQTQRGVGPDR